MPEHYQSNTTATLAFCPTCNRRTRHKVANKRLSDCLEHEAEGLSLKQQKARKKRQAEEQQPDLFGEEK